MAGALLVPRSALVAASVPSVARLAILVVTGSVIYVACCLWRAPEVSSEIRSALGGRRRTTQAVPGPVDAPLERV